MRTRSVVEGAHDVRALAPEDGVEACRKRGIAVVDEEPAWDRPILDLQYSIVGNARQYFSKFLVIDRRIQMV